MECWRDWRTADFPLVYTVQVRSNTCIDSVYSLVHSILQYYYSTTTMYMYMYMYSDPGYVLIVAWRQDDLFLSAGSLSVNNIFASSHSSSICRAKAAELRVFLAGRYRMWSSHDALQP